MTLDGVRVDGGWSRDHPSLSHFLWLLHGALLPAVSRGSFWTSSLQRARLRIPDDYLLMFILWQMIQESRFLIEMADTVQEKIVQCQKAGNLPSCPYLA